MKKSQLKKNCISK